MQRELTDVETWVVARLLAAGAAGSEEELADAAYLEQGLIDSFGLVELVVALESTFGVRLEPGHMQDPRFGTARGLSEIVDELR